MAASVRYARPRGKYRIGFNDPFTYFSFQNDIYWSIGLSMAVSVLGGSLLWWLTSNKKNGWNIKKTTKVFLCQLVGWSNLLCFLEMSWLLVEPIVKMLTNIPLLGYFATFSFFTIAWIGFYYMSACLIFYASLYRIHNLRAVFAIFLYGILDLFLKMNVVFTLTKPWCPLSRSIMLSALMTGCFLCYKLVFWRFDDVVKKRQSNTAQPNPAEMSPFGWFADIELLYHDPPASTVSQESSSEKAHSD